MRCGSHGLPSLPGCSPHVGLVDPLRPAGHTIHRPPVGALVGSSRAVRHLSELASIFRHQLAGDHQLLRTEMPRSQLLSEAGQDPVITVTEATIG